MIADLHDADHRVTVEGFYDHVRPLSDDEREGFRQLPFDEARWQEEAGVPASKTEKGYSILEGTTARPTLDVNGIWGGYTGKGAKTVLPSKATAKISCRLVPDQTPGEITDKLRRHFEAHVPDTMTLDFRDLHGGHGAIVDTTAPAMQAAADALEGVFGQRPHFTREGGSIPVVADFKRLLGFDTVLMGFGLDSDAIHSPERAIRPRPLPPGHRGVDPVHGRLRQARAVRAATLLALTLAVGACKPSTPSVSNGAVGIDTLSLPPRLAAVWPTESEAHVLDREGDVYALVRVSSDSGTVLLQWADLRAVAVEHVMGAVADIDAGPGLYHPTAPSPSFALVPGDSVVEEAERSGALAVLNGAFFETPGQPTSQLAFPVARRGEVVTGGSSPYGPGRPGAAAARWRQPLRALAMGDTLAHIAVYDPATGTPLDLPAFAEAVVSYAPEAHPSRIATRFHVLGTLDADGDGTTEILLIATSDGQTTISAPASLLSRLGVTPESQIALDGGASVLVWNRRAGTLHHPTPAGGHDPQHLPHYLTLRLR